MPRMFIFGSNINSTKKNTQDLFICSDVGLQINAGKTKYIYLMNRMQDKTQI
jgi:hypothetical protein